MADEAQQRVSELLARVPQGEADSFSHFDIDSAKEGGELAGELSQIAARDGVDAAISRAYEVADEDSLGVAKYALKLFVTHDLESAADLVLPTPELTDSEPLPPPGEGGSATGEQGEGSAA